jgi:hypothetical protein
MFNVKKMSRYELHRTIVEREGLEHDVLKERVRQDVLCNEYNMLFFLLRLH